MKSNRIKIGSVLMLICGVIFSTDLHAQRQSFTQYYLNLPSVNPGFTGLEPFMDVKMAFRQKWNGFDDKNRAFYLSGYTAIGRTSPTVFKNNSLRISNPEVYKNASKNTSVKRMHGVGGRISSQTVGPFKSQTFNGNYAYHLPLSGNISLSMGTVLGFTSYRISFADYEVRQENDPFIEMLAMSADGNMQQFTGDFGFALYTDNFYVGLSSDKLIQKSLGSELLNISTATAYQVVTGITKEINNQFTVYPGAKVRYSDLYKMTWEANLRVRYDDKIYLGFAYENEIKAALLLGLAFNNKYFINYSYDYYLNDLREFNTGNHEFTLGLAIFNKYSTPSRLW